MEQRVKRRRNAIMSASLMGLGCAFAASSQERDAIDVVVYSAPKMFFSSPELTPTLGPLVASGAPGKPTFGLDPGSRFAWALRNLLSERGLPILAVAGETVSAPPTTKRIANPHGAPHLIVFTTMNFLGYRPLHWRTYQYGYGAYVRITDAHGATLGEADCTVQPTGSNPDIQIARAQLHEPGAFDAVVDRAVQLCARQTVDEIAAALALIEGQVGQSGSTEAD